MSNMNTESALKSPIQAKPFLKWAGGKSQIIDEILNACPKHFNRYFEPFLGGGAVFFNLNPKQSFLSDVSNELINCFIIVKQQPEELAKELSSYSYSEEFYYQLREISKNPEFSNLSPLKRAARFIYLNKTCFNGLYRVNSQGHFNVPFGKYKNPQFFKLDNLLACSQALEGAQLNAGSYENILTQVSCGDFVYLDPPYSPLNQSASFTSYTADGFSDAKQLELKNFCDKLNEIGVKFLLSNSYTTLILSLYKNYETSIVKAKRAINSAALGRGQINEVLIRNY